MPNPCEDMEDAVATTTSNEFVLWTPLSDSVLAETIHALGTSAFLEDTAAFTDPVVESWYTAILDTVNAVKASDFAQSIIAVRNLTDTVRTTTSLGYGLTLPGLVDTVNLADTIETSRFLSLVDTVGSTTTLGHTLVAVKLLSDTVGASDSLKGGVSEAMVDTVNATDVSAQILRVIVALADSVATSDDYGQVYTPTVNLYDFVGSSTEIGMSLVAQQAISDVVNAATKYWYRDAGMVAWQMNTETLAANWLTNYEFESIAQYGDNAFAVNEDGIFVLSGSTDDSMEIAASLKTGFWDFETPVLKRIEGIYFGYHGGQMQVDVDTYGHVNGSNSYTMPAKTVSAPGANRVVPGKGIASRYWRLTISNVSGSYFDVDNIEFDVAPSKRRL